MIKGYYEERELAHEVTKRNWGALIQIKEENEGGEVQWEREKIKWEKKRHFDTNRGETG